MKTTPTTARRSAFTLIELLVVIAIIAILASILFPVFARARENARRSSCASNMKQLGLGFAQYNQDYDGVYPGSGNWQKWANPGSYWVRGTSNTAMAADTAPFATVTGQTADIRGGSLFPYTKSEQIYICPSSSENKAKNLSYSMNCALGSLKEAVVEQPTNIVLLVDEDVTLNDALFYTGGPKMTGGVVDVDANGDGIVLTPAVDQLTQLHLGGGNILYADGHVKFIQFSRFPTPMQRLSYRGDTRFYDPGFAGKCDL